MSETSNCSILIGTRVKFYTYHMREKEIDPYPAQVSLLVSTSRIPSLSVIIVDIYGTILLYVK